MKSNFEQSERGMMNGFMGIWVSIITWDLLKRLKQGDQDGTTK